MLPPLWSVLEFVLGNSVRGGPTGLCMSQSVIGEVSGVEKEVTVPSLMTVGTAMLGLLLSPECDIELVEDAISSARL